MTTRTVTVRLPDALHRLVKVRAAERGDSLEGIARAAFAAYLERGEDEVGSPLERRGVVPVGGGLAAGDAKGGAGSESRRASPAASSFRPDFKKG